MGKPYAVESIEKNSFSKKNRGVKKKYLTPVAGYCIMAKVTTGKPKGRAFYG